VIEMAGVGKIDKMQQAEEEEFRHYWCQTHNFKKKNSV
jgi:hypothetical protein